MTDRKIWEKYGNKMMNIGGRNLTLIIIDGDGDLVVEYEEINKYDSLWEHGFSRHWHYKCLKFGKIPNDIVPYTRVSIDDLIKGKFVNTDFIKF